MKMKITHHPKHKVDGKLKHVRIEMATHNKGTTVHAQYHGTPSNPYPSEESSAAFSTPEEGLHHAGKLMGADVTFDGDHGDSAGEEAAEEENENQPGRK